jgi:hypothetical protein
MKSKLNKSLLFILLSSAVTLPVFANSTDITLNGTYQDVVSLSLERTSDDFIVSNDNLDPVSNISGNEVLTLGNVNVLGLDTTTDTAVNRAITSVNGTIGNVQSKVIDLTDKLYDPIEQLGVSAKKLPKGNNKGALYYVEDAVQLRVLRGGGAATTPELSDIDFEATGTAGVQAFVKTSTASNSVVDGDDVTNNLVLNGATSTSLLTGLSNDTAQKLDIGLTVPYTLPNTTTTVSTQIEFTVIS